MIRVGGTLGFSVKLRPDTVLPHDFGNIVLDCRKSALFQFLMNPQATVTLFDFGMDPLIPNQATSVVSICRPMVLRQHM